jgi:hypothetical protein
MARFGVRSGSVSFARLEGSPANTRFERTGANGSERSLALATQKVVGSSPIIRPGDDLVEVIGDVGGRRRVSGLVGRLEGEFGSWAWSSSMRA